MYVTSIDRSIACFSACPSCSVSIVCLLSTAVVVSDGDDTDSTTAVV